MSDPLILGLLAAFVLVFAVIQLFFVRALVRFCAQRLSGDHVRAKAVGISLGLSVALCAGLWAVLEDAGLASVAAAGGVLLIVHIVVFWRFTAWRLAGPPSGLPSRGRRQ